MSCYLKHLKGFLVDAGIEVTTANRKEIDRAFHQIFDVQYKDCSSTWKKIKAELNDDKKRKELLQKLQISLKKV